MLTDKNTKPYERADVTITDMHPRHLAPAQLYVLRSEFEKVRDLRFAFLEEHGVDILRLADTKIRDGKVVPLSYDQAQSLGFIEYTTDQDPDQKITVLPPIVEDSLEANKDVYNIINDGMHRCFLARVSMITPAVVKIMKVPSNLPYYAYPLVNGWDDVTMVDALAPTLIKKFHRFKEPDYKAYYRDFNSAFTNVGGPRGKGTKPTLAGFVGSPSSGSGDGSTGGNATVISSGGGAGKE